MDNDEIAGFVETSDEWIRERTGVERRHIAEEETTVSMAVEAGRQAVEEAGISPEEIDMILVATGSADPGFPCLPSPARYRRLLELWVPLDLISMLHAVDFFSLTIQRRRT